MKRSLFALSVVLFVVATVAGQTPIPLEKIPPPTQMQRGQPRAGAEASGPQGEQKLRFICRQLHLNDEQMQQAEALIAVYNAELKDMEQNAAELLQKIQDKYAQIQAAKARNDDETVRILQDELRNMAPGVAAENHFMEGLKQILTDEQKARLPAALKRAESAGDISLRPVHVVRAVLKLGLSEDQQTRLEAIMEKFREVQVTSRPTTPQAADEQVNALVAEVRGILTPEQAQRFDQEIARLRDDPPPAKPMQLSDKYEAKPVEHSPPPVPPKP